MHRGIEFVWQNPEYSLAMSQKKASIALIQMFISLFIYTGGSSIRFNEYCEPGSSGFGLVGLF